MAPVGAGEGQPQAIQTPLSRVLEPRPTLWLSLHAGEGSSIPEDFPETPTRGAPYHFNFSKPPPGPSLAPRTGELEDISTPCSLRSDGVCVCVCVCMNLMHLNLTFF